MELKQKKYDLMNTRKETLNAAKAILLAHGETDEYKTKMAEVDSLNGQIEAVEGLMEQEEKSFKPNDFTPKSAKQTGAGELTGYAKAVKELGEAARNGFKTTKAVTPGTMANTETGADGGYMVPQDIETRVYALREEQDSLLSEVRVERVTAKTGRRTLRKRASHNGFATVAEAAKYPLLGTPQFTPVEYAIEKRGGVTAATLEVYDYSDEQIAAEVEHWLAGESAATASRLILDQVKTKEATALTSLDDILKAWVGLGSAFRRTSKLITNDDGLAWLGTLKDASEQYLLKTNVTNPSQLQLSVGPYVLPVTVKSNDTLPSDGTTVPFIIGDLAEGIVYWEKKGFYIRPSEVAVVGELNAYEQDLVLWKGSQWDDCTTWDTDAFVYGTLDTAAAAG